MIIVAIAAAADAAAAACILFNKKMPFTFVTKKTKKKT